MTTATTNAASPLADRMKELGFDERLHELPAELLDAPMSEETIGACIAWLEAHPRIPAWLNLDGICPAEMRAQIPGLIAEVEALAPVIDDLALRCWEVLRHFKANLDGLDDGYDITDPYTGRDKLAEPLLELGECFVVAAGEKAFWTSPKWSEVQS